MIDKNELEEMYDAISDIKLDDVTLELILPKIEIIKSKIDLDDVDLVNLVDVLLEFNQLGMMDKINDESLSLLCKIININDSIIDETIYVPILLKHLLIPYNLNKCQNEYDLSPFMAEFENMLESINKVFSFDDYKVLNKYNSELSNLMISYKKCHEIYENGVNQELILSTILSHIMGLFYFKMDDYNQKYELLEEITASLVDNYQGFIDYCIVNNIIDNFDRINLSSEQINKEYRISNDILDYAFSNEKIKRECK